MCRPAGCTGSPGRSVCTGRPPPVPRFSDLLWAPWSLFLSTPFPHSQPPNPPSPARNFPRASAGLDPGWDPLTCPHSSVQLQAPQALFPVLGLSRQEGGFQAQSSAPHPPCHLHAVCPVGCVSGLGLVGPEVCDASPRLQPVSQAVRGRVHLLLQAAGLDSSQLPPVPGSQPLPHHTYSAPLHPLWSFVLWWTEAVTEEVPYNYV